MTATRIACLGILSFTVAACSTVAPVKVAVGDQCFRCRRTISETRVAGETIDANGFVSKFRGPGCLAKYLVAHSDERPTAFVTDYATGKMIQPTDAVFVQEIVDARTRETDYRAYRLQADADAAAVALNTTPLRWDDVLDKAR